MEGDIAKRVVKFEGIGMCTYVWVRYGKPRKGEFYLSGAIVEAYKAPNDLSYAYDIVKPNMLCKRKMVWIEDRYWDMDNGG